MNLKIRNMLILTNGYIPEQCSCYAQKIWETVEPEIDEMSGQLYHLDTNIFMLCYPFTSFSNFLLHSVN